MCDLDGSDAGGQFVRSALALAVLENEPIRIENVRGDRSTPGLRHQHLAVLETMAEICEADVSGAELGAETIEFDPDLEVGGRNGAGVGADRPRLPGGDYAVDIGTAGSVTLLFEALLPLATILESPLSIVATGGTDVAWSPPIDYLRHVKLPLVRRCGLVAACEVERRGFYPDGGGRAALHLAPSNLRAIELAERGPIEGVRCYSTESTSLADRDVARRQLEGALERLSIADREDEPAVAGADAIGNGDARAIDDSIEVLDRRELTVSSPSPGSAIVLRIDHGTGVAGLSALGERGTPAERVGEDAADAARDWLEGAAPVDRHLADQLLVLLAVAGGRIRVPTVTDHVAAGCNLLRSFGIEPTVTDDGETAIVSIGASTTLL
ncbi:RNA 3'-terminal phosphate cyclase [Halosolutus gelatinilyticus]|uniref:RNA 3'-terminal phosphate cyclase n=1 Tax=Halosolutus gelatinilyticus TaxID=2931975 RepID=UPI001FF1094E|nr:RNA 3'-terminal phosphate cyclase [Halosolutus gelatinilyticus]